MTSYYFPLSKELFNSYTVIVLLSGEVIRATKGKAFLTAFPLWAHMRHLFFELLKNLYLCQFFFVQKSEDMKNLMSLSRDPRNLPWSMVHMVFQLIPKCVFIWCENVISAWKRFFDVKTLFHGIRLTSSYVWWYFYINLTWKHDSCMKTWFHVKRVLRFPYAFFCNWFRLFPGIPTYNSHTSIFYQILSHQCAE